MLLYRARAVRNAAGITPRVAPPAFDPLDSASSISRKGWRFNDATTEILYTAATEALSILEVAVRPGWESVETVVVAQIDTGSAPIAQLRDLGIVLPTNWNSRPVADDARTIAREFLTAVAAMPSADRPIGVFVPSVLSSTDYNVLVDPGRKAELSARVIVRMPFRSLRDGAT